MCGCIYIYIYIYIYTARSELLGAVPGVCHVIVRHIIVDDLDDYWTYMFIIYH